MDHSLNIKITAGKLLKYSLPTIISMVFMSIYTTVDGIFISNYVGTNGLSAINIVMPLMMIVLSIGMMLGAGGNALVAKKMGEGKTAEARQNFSLITLVAFLISVVISVIALIFREPILRVLGADDILIPLSLEYAVPLFIILPFALFGVFFQMFFIADGKPQLGMIISVLGGVTNIVLDYLFIAVYGMGLFGAALATGIGYSVPAVIGLFYFALQRKGNLFFVKPVFDWHVIAKSSANGASEMVTMLSTSVITIVFNNILIRLAGADGVAAITIILYIQGILSSVYMGYSSGIGPIISYNYGKEDTDKLKKIYSLSLRIILAMSITSLAVSLIFAEPLVGIFAEKGTAVFSMSVEGFRIFAVSFIFMGFNGFSSAMFTALNNGKISAILSFFRTLVFILIMALVLPLIWGITGVWIATPVAEVLAIFMTVYYFKKMKPVYKYA